MRRLVLAASVLAALAAPSDARATGMQGHIYMAQCAAEQLPPGQLRDLLDEQLLFLANGAFFTDSGYTNDADHDQGEIPHWDQFIEAYVQLLRDRYPDPYSDPIARENLATLLGTAAHGITDSTFDTLLAPVSNLLDTGSPDTVDLAADAFLCFDLQRRFVPEIVADVETLSDVFDSVQHPVTPEAITQAMSDARSGISLVAEFLSEDPTDFIMKFPWLHASYRDGRVPGSYHFGSRVVRRYWEEIEKRLAGNATADTVVIGVYPDDAYPLATIDAERPDARIVMFFGRDMDRTAFDATSLTVADAAGLPVTVDFQTFRGDEGYNVLVGTPAVDWAPKSTYTIKLAKTVKTLDGLSPGADQVFSFVTPCAEGDPDPTCPVAPPAPPSPCPIADASFPKDGAGGGGAGGSTGGAGGGAVAESGGCSMGSSGHPSSPRGPGAGFAAILLMGLLARRRRPA